MTIQILPRARGAARFITALVLMLAAAHRMTADVKYDERKHLWTLTTGPVEYRLEEDHGIVALQYFGPSGEPAWLAPKPRLRNYVRFDLSGQVEGQSLRPEELELTAEKISQPASDRAELLLTFRHRHLPFEVATRYITWGDTGVITRQITLTNRGPTDVHLEETPSLAWLLPPAGYSLDYLFGDWGQERQLTTEKLGSGTRSFVNRNGRSTNGYSPWFCLRDDEQGVRYGAQLAYSGNWQMSFEYYTERRLIPLPEQDLMVNLGMRYDFNGSGRLAPGKVIVLPEVAFTATTGDLDDFANQLHRYQRRYVMPTTPTNEPLITQYNTFESLGRKPQIADLKRYTDHAAELGLECIGPDAAWVIKSPKGEILYGDWREDPVGFPNGLKEFADYAHSKGLKFCLWLEPESTSKLAPIALQHPEWILKHNGVAMEGTRDRVYLDFRRTDVRAFTRAVMDRLVKEIRLDWIKIDYNADVRESFDPAEGERSGTVLYDHLQGLYGWFDSLRADYPNLIIENCSSGALRFDLALLGHTHFTWRSDVTTPRSSIQLAYGATLEFPPEASYHWMSGEDQQGHMNPNAPRGWWDFMFRVDMTGVFGIASRIDDWTPEMIACAKENIALYKRIRTVIKGADVYHLTPPPAVGENPTGWMTLQYVGPHAAKSVVMTFRLGQSEARQIHRLRGLDLSRSYKIMIDGKPVGKTERRSYTGRELATAGLTVDLDAQWRSAVIELEAQP